MTVRATATIGTVFGILRSTLPDTKRQRGMLGLESDLRHQFLITRSPLKRGGFSCFSDTTIGEATGGGVLMAAALAALAESLDKLFPWPVGFFFTNPELIIDI